MSKYVVETFYTCTFKIVHKLDELNEKKLTELQNDSSGKLEIIDVADAAGGALLIHHHTNNMPALGELHASALDELQLVPAAGVRDADSLGDRLAANLQMKQPAHLVGRHRHLNRVRARRLHFHRVM